jgi:hypothetical protein
MTDKEYNATRRRCLKLFDRWKNDVGLGPYEITYEFHREGIPDKGTPDVHTSLTTVMDVEASWKYMRAKVRVDMPSACTLEVAELEQTIVHEFMHIVLSELKPERQSPSLHDHEEHVAEHLARRFVAFRQALDSSKKAA